MVDRSPTQWRDVLTERLMARRGRVNRLEAYYRGDHPLPQPPERLRGDALREARRAFRELMRLGVTNWVKLVADAPSERLEVTGFRFGADGSSSDADRDVWNRIWQQNQLDADQGLVHDNALQTGQSFALVWFGPDGTAEITPEHSSQMIVAYEPGSRRKRAAALKLWDDPETGEELATLYLPDALWKWRRGADGDPERPWKDREDEPTRNPLGVVPVVEFRANPSLAPAPFGGGMAEYEPVLPIQDRINKTTFDRLVTAEYQAFRQRWIVGWEPERDPKTGLPRQDQVQQASQMLVWTFGGRPDEVKVGEFAQADFKAFTEAAAADVLAIAAISKTPPHYLLGHMVNISGDAMAVAETGLTAKSKKHARNFGESWEDVVRLALRVMGDPRAEDMSSQVIWGDIEHRSWGEQVDAVLKMRALDVPREELWSRLPDATPQDIARWRGMVAAEALLEFTDDGEATVPVEEPAEL